MSRQTLAITNEAVQLLKSKLKDKAPTTVNNVLNRIEYGVEDGNELDRYRQHAVHCAASGATRQGSRAA